MKRLLLIALLIIGCGSGSDTSVIDTSPIDTPTTSTAPTLIDVIILDGKFAHVPPKIWDVGDPWYFILYFNDAENDADHTIGYLYDQGTMEPMWGPYIFDLDGAIDTYSSSHGEPVIAEHTGLYTVGFIIVDIEGNESNELYRDVRIQ